MVSAHPIDWRITEQAVATSSSDLAKQAIDADAHNAEGQVFIVGEQTAGRGRRGRPWTSLPGDGLYMSIIICPQRAQQDWPSLSFVASLSACLAIEQLCSDITPQLKWPNDLLLNGQKLGGILLEAYQGFVIIGMGLNLKNAPHLEGSDWQATDLTAHGAGHITPSVLASEIVSVFEPHYTIWQDAGAAPLLARWQDKASLIGRQMQVRLADKMVVGCCQSFGADGSLMLCDAEDQLHHITAGDVVMMGDLDAASH